MQWPRNFALCGPGMPVEFGGQDHVLPSERRCVRQESLIVQRTGRARWLAALSMEIVFQNVMAAMTRLSAIAHFERRLISEHTRDGLINTRKHGRAPGRPSLPPETISALQELAGAGKSVSQAAKHLGMGRSTAYKAMRNATH